MGEIKNPHRYINYNPLQWSGDAKVSNPGLVYDKYDVGFQPSFFYVCQNQECSKMWTLTILVLVLFPLIYDKNSLGMLMRKIRKNFSLDSWYVIGSPNISAPWIGVRLYALWALMQSERMWWLN